MRTTFLVDGFNLYHSIIIAEKQTQTKLRWLNVHSLCKSYLPNINKNSQIEEIYYFSAYARHRVSKDANTINRHQAYIKALKSTNVIVQLGHFKLKTNNCPNCQNVITKYEEKETDVAIAVKMMEFFHLKKADHIVLVTGDTDLVPVVKTVNALFGKHVSMLYPFKRSHDAYSSLAYKTIKIKSNRYSQHQFDSPLPLSDGTTIYKPTSW